jgi:tetratricopeptide (TPR) repeat protein
MLDSFSESFKIDFKINLPKRIAYFFDEDLKEDKEENRKALIAYQKFTADTTLATVRNSDRKIDLATQEVSAVRDDVQRMKEEILKAIMADKSVEKARKKERIPSLKRSKDYKSQTEVVANILDKPDKNFDKANEFLKQGNFQAFQKAMDESVEPGALLLAETHYNKAVIYEYTSDYQNALASYKLAKLLVQENPKYLNGLGHFMLELAEYAEAVHLFDLGVERNIKNGHIQGIGMYGV